MLKRYPQILLDRRSNNRCTNKWNILNLMVQARLNITVMNPSFCFHLPHLLVNSFIQIPIQHANALIAVLYLVDARPPNVKHQVLITVLVFADKMVRPLAHGLTIPDARSCLSCPPYAPLGYIQIALRRSHSTFFGLSLPTYTLLAVTTVSHPHYLKY